MKLKEGKLPKPSSDSIEEALAALKQLPGTKKGRELLRRIVEDAIKQPSRLWPWLRKPRLRGD